MSSCYFTIRCGNEKEFYDSEADAVAVVKRLMAQNVSFWVSWYNGTKERDITYSFTSKIKRYY